MTESTDEHGDADNTESAEEIIARIEETRESLAGTIDALTAKLDVKTRARKKAAETKQRAADRVSLAGRHVTGTVVRVKDNATDDEGKPRMEILGAAAVAVVVVVLVVVFRQRATR